METENPKTETEKNNPTPKAPTLHTYKTDVAEYIKKEGKTMADIAIAESQRQTNVLREEEVEKIILKSQKNCPDYFRISGSWRIGNIYFFCSETQAL